MQARGVTTVGVDATTAYQRWRDLESLPTFMNGLEQVVDVGGGRSRWTASAPVGTVSWEAEVTADEPGQRLAWRSVEGAEVRNEGEVRFTAAPGDQGTEVRVSLSYDLPAGKLGAAVARLTGTDPHQALDDDLRRFKQVVETGEVVRSDGAPRGKTARGEFPQHAAQPLSKEELAEVGLA